MGELKSKQLGCDKNGQKLDYGYNIRGWLLNINNPNTLVADKDLFGMTLAYSPIGNISNWNYANGQINASTNAYENKGLYQYAFTYDNLNRLQTSNLTKTGTSVFSNQQSYDDNGNVLTLKRTFNGTMADNMTYNYQNGNRLNAIADIGTNPTTGGTPLGEFFKDGTANYNYDAAGNLISDTGKGINNVSYNFMNLTSKITQNGKTTNYTYAADGRKLTANYGVGKKYDYLSTGVYKNDTLEFIPTAEGRYVPNKTPPLGAGAAVATGLGLGGVYEYILKDHLGNARISCGCAKGVGLVVLQENHYDPWGLALPIGVEGNQRFTYNSKEKQEGTGWLDYGARMYSADNVRFTTIDPLSEQGRRWNPYAYVFDNPIKFIDPDGMFGDLYNSNGTHIGNDGEDDNRVYVVKTTNDKQLNQEQSKNAVAIADLELYGQSISPVHQLGVTHSEFQKLGGAVYAESSEKINSQEEKNGIASASVNNNEARGVNASLGKTLDEISNATFDGNARYAAYTASTPEQRNANPQMNSSNAAAVNALTGGKDYSSGATGWDGRDLKTNSHRTGLNISNPSHDIFKVGDSPLPSGKYVRQTTATYGQTVFMKIHNDHIKGGGRGY